jgi:2-methylcitrate dehydratase PrpD
VHLAREHDVHVADIERIVCPIHDDEVAVVCEPRERKVAPSSDYEAKFSLHYAVAAALVRRRFSLGELEPSVRSDDRVLALARRVEHCPDPASGYPHAYSGEVRLHLTDGRVLRHRVPVNRGARQRPVGEDEIVEKFLENAEFAALDASTGGRLVDAVMSLDTCEDAAVFAELFAALPRGDARSAPLAAEGTAAGRAR